MREIQYSSGDIVADRRASYAAALAAERAFPEAAELMAQALELVPQWVAGWNLLGGYREEAGDIAGAIVAWTQVHVLDAAGAFGARLKLAAHGASTDTAPAPAYVEALFDDYAPRFEQSLVEKLGYRTPDRMAAAIMSAMASRGIERFNRAIDLGCGTGLMGERLRPLAEQLEGVDLSRKMLGEARRKGIYDRLEKAELVAFLRGEAEADLIVAADVFNYVGALEPVVAAVSSALKPGGLVAFSLETHAGPEPVRLGTSLRYQHAGEQTLELCRSAGLEVVSAEVAAIRNDRGAPVDGMIVVAVRPGR